MLRGRSQTLRCRVVAAHSGCTPRQCPRVPPSPAVSPPQRFLPWHPPCFMVATSRPATAELGKPDLPKEEKPIPSPAERRPTSLPFKQKPDPCKKLLHPPGGDTEVQKAVGSCVPRHEPSTEPKATVGPCTAATQPGLSRRRAAPFAPSFLMAHFGKALKKINCNFLLRLIGTAAKWLIWLLLLPRVVGKLALAKARRLGRWRGAQSLAASVWQPWASEKRQATPGLLGRTWPREVVAASSR